MPTRLLAIPLILISAVLLYLSYAVSSTYGLFAIPSVMALTMTYILSPQIDWWYYSRHPKDLPAPLRHLINRYSPFYQGLSLDGKKRFRERVGLFLMVHNFTSMNDVTIPEEYKAILAANVVHLTFGQEDFLLEKFERVIFYEHPFPSPQFPKDFHVCESYEEDGVLLFTVDHLIKGFQEPTRYYNIGLHESIQAWFLLHPNKQFPALPQGIEKQLEQISLAPMAAIQEAIGLPTIKLEAVSLCHFLMFPTAFHRVSPDLFEALCGFLNLNPLEAAQPIRYINEA